MTESGSSREEHKRPGRMNLSPDERPKPFILDGSDSFEKSKSNLAS